MAGSFDDFQHALEDLRRELENSEQQEGPYRTGTATAARDNGYGWIGLAASFDKAKYALTAYILTEYAEALQRDMAQAQDRYTHDPEAVEAELSIYRTGFVLSYEGYIQDLFHPVDQACLPVCSSFEYQLQLEQLLCQVEAELGYL